MYIEQSTINNSEQSPLNDNFLTNIWEKVTGGGNVVDEAKKELMSGVGQFTDDLVQKNLPIIKEACKGGTMMGIREYGWEVWAMGISFVGLSVGLGFWLGTLAKK